MSLELEGSTPFPMESQGEGWFTLDCQARHGQRYRFVLPDGLAIPDPASRAQQGDVHGWSVVVDHAEYRWRCTSWRGRPWHEAVIMELHAGAMGGFAGVARSIPAIAAAGITCIELMPVADFPGARNWGYDGVLPYAPDETYGTPDDLKNLIDTAHEHGLMVMLDVVYNHFGPDGAYIHRVATEFFDEAVHTPWGAAIDFNKHAVRDFFVDNAAMWLNEYRFDGLRMDAVSHISPPEALPKLARDIRAAVDREVHLVIEHEGNRASVLREGPGRPGFDAQWADDFHHAVHVLLTGELEGYYDAFTEPAAKLARVLAEGFAYQGEIPPRHTEPRGEPSGHLPPTAFVVCLQNHDQIGNRAFGERLTALVSADAIRAANTLLLLCPFIPLLFMGDQWGTKTPFLFFTDHHDELADLVREGRRTEFGHFGAFSDEALRDKIPDPNAVDTFTASIPDPAEAGLPENAAFASFHRNLLSLRAAHIVPGIPGCRSQGAAPIGAHAVRGTWRLGTGGLLTIIANFAGSPLAAPSGAGRLLASSRDGDAGAGDLPPLTTRVFLDSPA